MCYSVSYVKVPRSENAADASRFANLNDDEFNALLNGRLSTNTKQVIKSAMATFYDYARSKDNTVTDIDQMSVVELDNFLGRFYAEARKADGSMYARKSLLSLRYGIAQHFKKTRSLDITKSGEFASSIETFAAVLVQLKQTGNGSVIHKEPLSTEDFNKLYSSEVLSTAKPAGLENKVFVDIMVQLCNRGRENLRELTCNDFYIAKDSGGHRYVAIRDKLKKNHRGDSDVSQQGRIYETPE